MTIDEIHKNEDISVRSYNVCKYNGLKSIEDLQKYYLKYNSFENLRNCGRRSNEELIELCNKYQSKIFDGKNTEIQTFSLERIIYSLTKSQRENINNFIIDSTKSLSVRSRNAIYKFLNGNLQIENLYKRKLLSNTFNLKSIKNIGKKCTPELETYIANIKSNILEDPENNEILNYKVSNPLEEILANLTRIQREVINSFIQVNTNSLSVRSKNAISQFLNYNFKVRNFAEKIFLNKHFSVQRIENVGKKSIPELEIYFSLVKDFLMEVIETDDKKKLITLKNNFLIQRTFSVSKIPIEILESESIFQLVDFLLNQNLCFEKSQMEIITKGLKIYNNYSEFTLDEIANLSGLTGERVRQIRKLSLEQMPNKLLFIRNFNEDLFQNYGIDISANQIEITQDLANNINNRNNTNFSKEFVTLILSVYLQDDFSLIGKIEDVLQPKYSNNRNRHNWNNLYLVRKELISKLDFELLTNDIDERINERIEETYSFNFRSYLSKFISNEDIETIDLVFPIAENIVNDECKLYLDLDDDIVFQKNTAKQAYEYAYEALEKLGKPSKVQTIFKKVKELFPNYETDVNKVRASMKRKDGFVPIGRNSVFGLKKWEKELNDFKGGTIRSITAEYLGQSKEPKHITKITEYVLKYRPKSNEKSIYYNLRIDESETFAFFKNSFIGLKDRVYSEDFIILEDSDSIKRNTWEDRYKDLISFISIENRLPLSIGVPEEEIKLYRWINVQKRSIKLGKLDDKKANLINQVFQKFHTTNRRRRLNSEEKYIELLTFIETNHRMPTANRKNEENLYQFYYKQRKLYSNDSLDDKEKVQFLEVSKLLKNMNL